VRPRGPACTKRADQAAVLLRRTRKHSVAGNPPAARERDTHRTAGDAAAAAVRGLDVAAREEGATAGSEGTSRAASARQSRPATSAQASCAVLPGAPARPARAQRRERRRPARERGGSPASRSARRSAAESAHAPPSLAAGVVPRDARPRRGAGDATAARERQVLRPSSEALEAALGLDQTW
jgi:hypothetical protein